MTTDIQFSQSLPKHMNQKNIQHPPGLLNPATKFHIFYEMLT